MWAAKLPGEGALLYDACSAMCQVMSEIGVAVDGGKDSLSMAARVGPDTIKAPGYYETIYLPTLYLQCHFFDRPCFNLHIHFVLSEHFQPICISTCFN